jgi:hypothetical protein
MRCDGRAEARPSTIDATRQVITDRRDAVADAHRCARVDAAT